MLPPFTLPEDPSKKITLREATVADCIDFADVMEGCEEEVTTLFLNRVQEKSGYIDSATWTGESRRFALLWYWLHTVKDPEVAHSYDCAHCGGEHTFLLNYHRLFEEYRAIEGKAERDIEFDGVRYTVRPLTGADLEAIEGMRLSLKGDPKSGAYRRQLALIRLERFERSLHPVVESPTLKEKVKGAFRGYRKEEKAAAPQSRLSGMTETRFSALAALVQEKLAEMTHGLNSVYEDGEILLITPPHQCPDKGGTTRLRVPFRNSDAIPELFGEGVGHHPE